MLCRVAVAQKDIMQAWGHLSASWDSTKDTASSLGEVMETSSRQDVPTSSSCIVEAFKAGCCLPPASDAFNSLTGMIVYMPERGIRLKLLDSERLCEQIRSRDSV
jgi:hypothetical protein